MNGRAILEFGENVLFRCNPIEYPEDNKKDNSEDTRFDQKVNIMLDNNSKIPFLNGTIVKYNKNKKIKKPFF